MSTAKKKDTFRKRFKMKHLNLFLLLLIILPVESEWVWLKRNIENGNNEILWVWFPQNKPPTTLLRLKKQSDFSQNRIIRLDNVFSFKNKNDGTQSKREKRNVLDINKSTRVRPGYHHHRPSSPNRIHRQTENSYRPAEGNFLGGELRPVVNFVPYVIASENNNLPVTPVNYYQYKTDTQNNGYQISLEGQQPDGGVATFHQNGFQNLIHQPQDQQKLIQNSTVGEIRDNASKFQIYPNNIKNPTFSVFVASENAAGIPSQNYFNLPQGPPSIQNPASVLLQRLEIPKSSIHPQQYYNNPIINSEQNFEFQIPFPHRTETIGHPILISQPVTMYRDEEHISKSSPSINRIGWVSKSDSRAPSLISAKILPQGKPGRVHFHPRRKNSHIHHHNHRSETHKGHRHVSNNNYLKSKFKSLKNGVQLDRRIFITSEEDTGRSLVGKNKQFTRRTSGEHENSSEVKSSSEKSDGKLFSNLLQMKLKFIKKLTAYLNQGGNKSPTEKPSRLSDNTVGSYFSLNKLLQSMQSRNSQVNNPNNPPRNSTPIPLPRVSLELQIPFASKQITLPPNPKGTVHRRTTTSSSDLIPTTWRPPPDDKEFNSIAKKPVYKMTTSPYSKYLENIMPIYSSPKPPINFQSNTFYMTEPKTPTFLQYISTRQPEVFRVTTTTTPIPEQLQPVKETPPVIINTGYPMTLNLHISNPAEPLSSNQYDNPNESNNGLNQGKVYNPRQSTPLTMPQQYMRHEAVTEFPILRQNSDFYGEDEENPVLLVKRPDGKYQLKKQQQINNNLHFRTSTTRPRPTTHIMTTMSSPEEVDYISDEEVANNYSPEVALMDDYSSQSYQSDPEYSNLRQSKINRGEYKEYYSDNSPKKPHHHRRRPLKRLPEYSGRNSNSDDNRGFKSSRRRGSVRDRFKERVYSGGQGSGPHRGNSRPLHRRRPPKKIPRKKFRFENPPKRIIDHRSDVESYENYDLETSTPLRRTPSRVHKHSESRRDLNSYEELEKDNREELTGHYSSDYYDDGDLLEQQPLNKRPPIEQPAKRRPNRPLTSDIIPYQSDQRDIGNPANGGYITESYEYYVDSSLENIPQQQQPSKLDPVTLSRLLASKLKSSNGGWSKDNLNDYLNSDEEVTVIIKRPKVTKPNQVLNPSAGTGLNPLTNQMNLANNGQSAVNPNSGIPISSGLPASASASASATNQNTSLSATANFFEPTWKRYLLYVLTFISFFVMFSIPFQH